MQENRSEVRFLLLLLLCCVKSRSILFVAIVVMATVAIVPYVRLPECKSMVLVTLAKPAYIASVCLVSLEVMSRRTLKTIPPEEQTICSSQQPSVYGADRPA